MYTFLGVNAKPGVPCKGVIDFSTRTGHQGECIGGFLSFHTIGDNFHALHSTPCLLFLRIVMERYTKR